MTDNYKVKLAVLAPIGTNCYVVINSETSEAIVVDPASEDERLNKALEGVSKIAAVLITHGHYDHIGGVSFINEKYGPCDIVCSATEKEWMETQTSISPELTKEVAKLTNVLVEDNDEIEYAGIKFKVMQTPGHTAGSVCYLSEDQGILFSGDTLFKETCGRVDLPTGDARSMKKSLARLKAEVADDVVVLPGHAETSVMGYEKENNIYMA